MEYKRVYTKPSVNDLDQRKLMQYTYPRKAGSSGPAIFIWGDADDVRILNIEAVAKQHVDKLSETFADHKDWYTDLTPNSATKSEWNDSCQWNSRTELFAQWSCGESV
ncbi:hypothetical protein BDV40DRAFT_257042 [Aspergillus tamarii]|uniref:Uncharacterized protein n=1 Tax=Aspergillus tamarii TaxID=41984 RepID=A0A5N6V4U8_ASPTM|nr:hypothetical protein BDV40DRAFT_257042 [Aspergillus tamarii]